MKFQPGIVHVMLAGACLASGGVVAARQPAGGAPTEVVATVGATPIFRSELDAVVRRSLAAGGVPEGQADEAVLAAGSGRRQMLEAMAIEQIIDSRLLRAEIDRERITVSRMEVDNRLAQLKQQVAARGVEWDRFLAQTGREEGAIKDQIALEISLDRLIRPKLTPAAINAGFERHRRELDGTRLKVSHVVLRPDAALGEEGLAAAQARAMALRREIVQGELTFADAARRHSVGPSRTEGGDLGWIGRDGPLVDAFTKEAFALGKGDVSKPIVTPFGVHLVQVTAIEPGHLGLDALRPKVEALLAETTLRETLARLRATTPVSFGDGVAHFDPATPAEAGRPRRIVVGDAPGSAAPP